jgi:hypothetical protein
LAQANAYLESEYLPEWNSKFTVVPACGDDAHRKLGQQHALEAILCPVDHRVIASDYTIRHEGKLYQIAAGQIRPRMRGATVRVESRRSGQIAVRFEDGYLEIVACQPAAKANARAPRQTAETKASQPARKSQWMRGFFDRPGPTLSQAIGISNATRLKKQKESRANPARQSFAFTRPRPPLGSFTTECGKRKTPRRS